MASHCKKDIPLQKKKYEIQFYFLKYVHHPSSLLFYKKKIRSRSGTRKYVFRGEDLYRREEF